MSNDSRCPVCGHVGPFMASAYRHAHEIFAGLQRKTCHECGMVFASPMPDEAALATYNASYFDSAHGGASTDPVTVAFHAAINRLRVAHVARYLELQGKEVRAVLEVGAGAGHFARHWLGLHPATNYWAIETDSKCIAALRAIGVEMLADPGVLERPLDLVVMSHVLEHAADPSKFLRETTASLKAGGVLFVEVPCRDWEFKTQDEPHLLFFDKAPLERLLISSGFRDVQLSYHGREIDELRSPSFVKRALSASRSRLLARGIIAPFGRPAAGLETVDDPLQRAAVAPFLAHRESSRPASWLRALTQKR